MSLGELLRTKSSEYELLAEWHAERAPLDDEHLVACQAMAWSGSCSGRSPRRSTWSGVRRPTSAEEPVAVSGRVLTRPRVGSTRSHEKLAERFRNCPRPLAGPTAVPRARMAPLASLEREARPPLAPTPRLPTQRRLARARRPGCDTGHHRARGTPRRVPSSCSTSPAAARASRQPELALAQEHSGLGASPQGGVHCLPSRKRA
jgi:hypothetical protein